jgi:hypothetical protein
MTIKQLLLANALLAALVATSSQAEDQQGRNNRRGPPQVAIDACAELQEGDACSFTGRNNQEVNGTCFAPPQQEDRLACKPDDFDERRGRRRAPNDGGSPDE